jgi:hypothetical protein
MTTHSRLLFAHHMNDQFYRADGLGAARLRRRFTSAIRSTLSPNVWPIRSAIPSSTRYAVVQNALHPPQARQFQATLAPVAVKSP